jgi:hypothetical protein
MLALGSYKETDHAFIGGKSVSVGSRNQMVAVASK